MSSLTLEWLLAVSFFGAFLLLLGSRIMATVQNINDKLTALKADVARVAALFANGNGVATQTQIDAIDAAVTGIQADVAAIPTPGPNPDAPGVIAINDGGSQVKMSWDAVANAVSYRVKRGDTSGSEVLVTSTDVTSFTDTTTVPNKTYFYTVSAVNAAGVEGKDSAEVSVAVL